MADKIISGGLIIGLVLMLGMGCTRRANRAVSDYVGDLSQDQQVYGNQNGNRIRTYEKFHDQYNTIQQQKASLQMRINNGEEFKSLTAEIQILNGWIGEYNSDSSKFNQTMWKDSNLPYKLEYITSVDGLK